jgi:glutamyl-tRNA synthetase
MDTVRTRIAPSPSGFLHIGTAKTALYNYLFAKKHGGRFILRLEDTDVERTDERFAQGMCEGFEWLGIVWDEGPDFGGQAARGDFGPYRQSQRRELHKAEAMRLVAEGKAYKCFCTKEEIDAFREQYPHERFPSRWRDAAPGEAEAMGNAPFVVRFRVPEGETVIQDLIQGEVRFNNREYDDFVILRPNGDPVFHLAVVVDDAHMRISHVIRGDDHLTNAGRHAMLFDALGFERPKFAHHPLVHDEQGRKFSKRLHGANVLDWRADGYLPETIVNYVALLGWTSTEENREFFTREELVEHFTIERVTKSAARFDRKKLDWLNGQHIRRLSVDQFRDRILPILREQGFDVDARPAAWLTRMAEITQEKVPTLNAITGQVDFFFAEPAEYEEKGVQKNWMKEGALDCMRRALATMAAREDWGHDSLHAAFQRLSEETETGLGKYVNPVRLALTGKTVGPGLFELAELLGKEACIGRMERAIQYMEQAGSGQ